MAYKTGVEFIVKEGFDYSYFKEDDVMYICAENSINDITDYYKVFVDKQTGELVSEYLLSEEIDEIGKLSEIDCLYNLKHGKGDSLPSDARKIFETRGDEIPEETKMFILNRLNKISNDEYNEFLKARLCT